MKIVNFTETKTDYVYRFFLGTGYKGKELYRELPIKKSMAQACGGKEPEAWARRRAIDAANQIVARLLLKE